ncbi:HNH endonuclease [Bradyrhizobium viridifuturi]|uniref:HNH endonuclease n=1 Tax=Bradyrhizobium viridifuturi TaxID=1654716 RepID=UPI000AC37925|nr:HNH endonuclease [Bradyrhizobium viridifuturi]
MPNGFTDDDWTKAKGEIQVILSQRVLSNNPLISYGELAARISTLQISPDDDRLAKLLDEISTTESTAGRGMLSVVVVHQDDKRPGAGFFKLAKRLGRNSRDQDELWMEEFRKVRLAWERQSAGASASSHASKGIQGRSIETLPFLIPECSFPSHPISRGAPKFHKLGALTDSVEGRTLRTEFFEQTLVGMFLRLGRAVPYAFYSSNGEIRSLDAGCIKFLLNRSAPEILVNCDDHGEIVGVVPLPSLVARYALDEETFHPFVGDELESELPFDPEDVMDERRRVECESVRRVGSGAFRSVVMWAWRGRCAVTRTTIQCVLDAAHIRRYNGMKTNIPCNGIALRNDLHTLFDNHLLSFSYSDDRLVLDISKDLRGTEYEAYAAIALDLPAHRSHRPHPLLVEQHHKGFREREAARG